MATGSYIGAIDQGTTSTRFIVFDRSGRTVAIGQREHEQIYPHPGWVEHDAEEIWRRTGECIAQAMEQRGLRASDLAVVGIANQRETTVVWNRQTGKPAANAIVWQDVRVADVAARFAKDGGTDRFRAQTGLPLSPYFSGLKIRWILEHVPGIRQQAEAGDVLFGNIDTFLAWHLTGRHVTDVTSASRTQFMNLHTLAWDRDICGRSKFPKRCCPGSAPAAWFTDRFNIRTSKAWRWPAFWANLTAALFYGGKLDEAA